MPRETIEERRARLTPGARWIQAQRDERGWSGRELARRLGISQDRISAYERAQDEPPADFARALAELFGLSEIEVWRGLGKPLPREATSDEEMVAYATRDEENIAKAWRLRPDTFEKMGKLLGFTPPVKARPTLVRQDDVAHVGEPPCRASYG